MQFSVKHEQNIDCGGGYVKVSMMRVCCPISTEWANSIAFTKTLLSIVQSSVLRNDSKFLLCSQLFSSELDQKDMHGDSAYNIMFGKQESKQ